MLRNCDVCVKIWLNLYNISMEKLDKATPSNAAAFHAQISGRVQGVGFRYSAQREAERLRLNGFVRNTDRGNVEVWAEGPPDKLEVFLKWLRRGPEYSRVDSVVKEDMEPRNYRGFGVEL